MKFVYLERFDLLRTEEDFSNKLTFDIQILAPFVGGLGCFGETDSFYTCNN